MFAADPFVGTWKLDPARSSGTIPKDETVIIQERGQTLSVEVQVTIGGPDNSVLLIKYATPKRGGAGRVEKGPYDGVSLHRIDARSMETVYLSGGKEIRSTWASVSKDGRTMTSTGRTLSEDEKSAWVMVFQKQLKSNR
jgi:hypothetical protein